MSSDPVGRYLALGLALGRHVEGLVDAYYGPPELAARAEAEGPRPPAALVAEARRLLADLDSGVPLGPGEGHEGRRRAWLRAQVVGLLTTARRLAGEPIAYPDEVEACYGVRPTPVPEERLAEAHRTLEAAVPGSGPLKERYGAWREAHAIPAERLEGAIGALLEVLRSRTASLFGLPEGERVDFELVTGAPWAGFNYYLGGLRSRVAVNTDLPVLSTGLAHLVAHEAYPGHHTEHSTKEVALVRRRRQLEESIFLVGTPQCLVSEGLADLGLEMVLGPRPESAVAEVLWPLGIRYDAETLAATAQAAEVLSAIRANAALALHAEGADPEAVCSELERWALLPRRRAEKLVSFLLDPTWRAYVSCYVEGLPLCRSFVAGRPERFLRLLSEQLTPADLRAEAGRASG